MFFSSNKKVIERFATLPENVNVNRKNHQSEDNFIENS